MADLSWLSKSTRGHIERAAKEIQAALGEHLEAALLVGSAVHPERHDRGRLPEILVIADAVDAESLRRLAERVHDSIKHGVRVRVLTHAELVASSDVFTVEVAEYKAQHVLLAGRNPFGDVNWSDADLRRSVEQALRGLGRRLRNRVLTGLATDGERDDPSLAVAHGVDRFVIVARYALDLLDGESPSHERAVIEGAAQRAGVAADELLALLEAIRRGRPVGDPVAAVDMVLAVLDPLVAEVDAA